MIVFGEFTTNNLLPLCCLKEQGKFSHLYLYIQLALMGTRIIHAESSGFYWLGSSFKKAMALQTSAMLWSLGWQCGDGLGVCPWRVAGGDLHLPEKWSGGQGGDMDGCFLMT